MYESMTYEDILERMLNRIPDTYDKREGSIIYNALAPAAVELQNMYIQLDVTLNEAFADTASREYLVKRAAERGLEPYPATYSIVQGEFTPSSVEIPIGARFSCSTLNYMVNEKINAGTYKLQCESTGEQGNIPFGDLIPINYIDGLETAKITEVLIPGEDEESVEDLRKRYFNSFDQQAFGGNIADYQQKTNALDGVGACKVYPVWNGGGTVKLIILDAEYNTPSSELVKTVQNAIDPSEQGTGLGLAPIGHIVTVEGATSEKINIQTVFTFNKGYQLESALPSLQAAIDQYLKELRETWQNENGLIVRISQIESRLLDCNEIVDIQDTKINGAAKNLTLSDTQVPVRGTINGK